MTVTYSFNEISKCNMCDSEPSEHVVLGQRLNRSLGFKPKKLYGIAVTVMKCKRCGLNYPNPLPVPLNIDDHYNIPPSEYWADIEKEVSVRDFSDQTDKALRLLGGSKSDFRALDIGVGKGQAMDALIRAGFDAYGVEPSAQFREFAVDTFGIKPEKIKHAMIEDVEYPEDFFDFVTFGAVLEHLYDPSECIRRTIGWLKPGGVVHIEVPSSRHLVAKLINIYYKIIGTNYVTNLSPMHSPFHLYEFDLRSFEEHAKKNGYEIAEFYYYICKIYHFPEFTHSILRNIMKSFNMGMQLEIWLRKR